MDTMLKNEFSAKCDEIEANQKLIAKRKTEAADLLALVADAQTGTAARTKLTQQYMSAKDDIEVLEDLTHHLAAQRDAVYLKPYFEALQAAGEKKAEMFTLASIARHALDAAAQERLRFYNRGGRNADTPEAGKERLELEVRFAAVRTESSIAADNYTRAEHAVRRAGADLDQARKEVDAEMTGKAVAR
jgi:hypothetical protein